LPLDDVYRVSVEMLPYGYSVKSIVAGKIDLTSNPIRIGPSNEEDIEITLQYSTPSTVRVSGSLVGQKAAAVKSKKITLKSLSDGVKSVTAVIQENGSFIFETVAPGNFEIRLDPEPDSIPRALRVGLTDLSDLAVPAFLPTFRVTGKLPSEVELRMLGFLPGDISLSGTGRSPRVMLENMDPRSRGALELMKRTQPQFEIATPGYVEPGKRIEDGLSRKGAFEFRSVPEGDYRLIFLVGESDVCCKHLQTGVMVTVRGGDVDLGTVKLNSPAEP
jgi:hypothetical protein